MYVYALRLMYNYIFSACVWTYLLAGCNRCILFINSLGMIIINTFFTTRIYLKLYAVICNN